MRLLLVELLFVLWLEGFGAIKVSRLEPVWKSSERRVPGRSTAEDVSVDESLMMGLSGERVARLAELAWRDESFSSKSQ